MSKPDLEPRPPVFTPLDAARYRLAVLVHEADQRHAEGHTLTARQLRLLAEAVAEVARLQGVAS